MSTQLALLRIPPSSINYRKEFHSANKDSNESIEDWYNRLRELGESCNYGPYLEAFLLDKFVIGLDGSVLEHLGAEPKDLSLANIIDLCRDYDLKKENQDIKPVLITIKEEENVTSDAENHDDLHSIHGDENHAQADHDENMQQMVPYMAEACIAQPYREIPELFECYLCHKAWKTVGNLSYHFARYHVYGKTPKCHLCGKWIKDGSNMVRHLNGHFESKPYQCKLCDFSFARSTTFNRHMVRHNDAKTAKFECAKCQKIFISRQHLGSHMKTHDGPKITLSQKFDEIKEQKSSKDKLLKVAPSESVFTCEVCASTFSDSSTYENHLKIHCEPEYLCHLCGKKLMNKRNLIYHYRVHTGEKPFKCNDCDRDFSCKEKLKLHAKSHNGIRPHICTVCNKSFIQKGHLLSHSKKHMVKDLEFKCSQCPKQFATEEKFNTHIRIHLGLKPLECHYCEKTFKSNSHRNDHERTHTGERPYVCNICGNKFGQSSTLSGHMKWHSKTGLLVRPKKKKVKKDAVVELEISVA